MVRGWESVGGHLILTNQRLVFEPHRVNVQRYVDEFDPHDISSVAKTWSRTRNGQVRLAPNVIEVTFRDGRVASFVVWRRTAWCSALAPFINGDR